LSHWRPAADSSAGCVHVQRSEELANLQLQLTTVRPELTTAQQELAFVNQYLTAAKEDLAALPLMSVTEA
jgi:hypothetical protein